MKDLLDGFSYSDQFLEQFSTINYNEEFNSASQLRAAQEMNIV